MKDCCGDKENELTALRSGQGRVLKIVLLLNLVMFFVEATAGFLANSTALLADSLDMLGDSLVYGFSLYVIHRSSRWKALSAIIKGILMASFGLLVLGEATYKIFTEASPSAETMGLVGLLALVANLICLLLLLTHRHDDINMNSTWICSRNDIISNSAVLVTAVVVRWTGSKWPDIVVGFGMALLFLGSALPVLRRAIREYNNCSLIMVVTAITTMHF